VAFVVSPKIGCSLVNDMVVGDNNCGQIYRFELSADRRSLGFTGPALQDRVADNAGAPCSGELSEVEFGSGFGVVTDIENGPDGRLYVVSLSDGAIFRIVRAAGSVPDGDGDEVADACDCARTNAAAFAVPGEVPSLRLSGTAPTAGWDSQSARAGVGTTYAVVRGDVADLRSSGGFESACTLASGLTTTTVLDSSPSPAADQARYYLVRSVNACGSGSFGDSTLLPDPRDSLDASSPLPCS
jgi:hypothetical protein